MPWEHVRDGVYVQLGVREEKTASTEDIPKDFSKLTYEEQMALYREACKKTGVEVPEIP